MAYSCTLVQLPSLPWVWWPLDHGTKLLAGHSPAETGGDCCLWALCSISCCCRMALSCCKRATPASLWGGCAWMLLEPGLEPAWQRGGVRGGVRRWLQGRCAPSLHLAPHWFLCRASQARCLPNMLHHQQGLAAHNGAGPAEHRCGVHNAAQCMHHTQCCPPCCVHAPGPVPMVACVWHLMLS